MLTAYLKGVAAVSTAGLLLFGAGSAARAELTSPPSAPVGRRRSSRPPIRAPDADRLPSQSQNAPGTESRQRYGPSGPAAA